MKILVPEVDNLWLKVYKWVEENNNNKLYNSVKNAATVHFCFEAQKICYFNAVGEERRSDKREKERPENVSSKEKGQNHVSSKS